MNYVCGLLFSTDKRHVALVRKNRPDWQAGKLNAIGGKIEEGEAPYQAVRREFVEEAGVDRYDWRQFARLVGQDFTVYFYASFSDDIANVETKTDEKIELWVVKQALLCPSLIPNLKVMIPLALDESGIVKPVIFEDNR